MFFFFKDLSLFNILNMHCNRAFHDRHFLVLSDLTEMPIVKDWNTSKKSSSLVYTYQFLARFYDLFDLLTSCVNTSTGLH